MRADNRLNQRRVRQTFCAESHNPPRPCVFSCLAAQNVERTPRMRCDYVCYDWTFATDRFRIGTSLQMPGLNSWGTTRNESRDAIAGR